MNLYRIRILFIRHMFLILFFPLLVAVLVFFIVRNKPQEYTSTALLYTGFASGYDLESTEGGNTNNFGVNSAFDNLISTVRLKSTLEEVSIKLLAQYLTSSPANLGAFSPDDSLFLRSAIPVAYGKEITEERSLESVEEILYKQFKENDPHVKQIVNNGYSPIGVAVLLSNLEASRVNNSDMIQISYKATDPYRAQATLSILVNTLIKRYKMAKTGEASSVVAYFENQLNNSARLLKATEDSLKLFSSDTKIVNAEEDIKAAATQRKSIESSIDEEISALAASEAALRQLNAKLSKVKEGAGLSVSVNALRDSLSTLNARLTLMQNSSSQSNTTEIALQNKIQKLEKQLKAELISLDASYNSQDGIPARMLLTTWVNTMLEADKSRARLQSLQALQEKKKGEFQTVVPLGVEMNRLKRNIAQAEANYWGILDNLNKSRLREQNMNIASNLRILDEPTFPNSPESSKKTMLVFMGFMASLILVLGFITGKELLDSTIKAPEQCPERLQMPFAGALPDITIQQPYTEKAVNQLLHQCINSIKIPFNSYATPLTLILFSTQPGDGKTFVGRMLARQLTGAGLKTLLVTSQESDDLIIDTPDIKIVELNSLNQDLLPLTLLSKAHLSLVIVPANRKWTSADEHMLNIYRETITHPVHAFINRIEWIEIKRLLGTLPVAFPKQKAKTIKIRTADVSKKNIENSVAFKG